MSHKSGHVIVNIVDDDNGNRTVRIEIEPGMTVDDILEAVRAALEDADDTED